MAENIIHIENLSKAYVRSIKTAKKQDAIEQVSILKHLDLSIEKGSITALIGGNGSGKTTLFNIINGFLNADEGSVKFINGATHELMGKNPDKIARLGLGRSFQDNHIFGELSLLENMLVAGNDTFGEIPFVAMFAPQRTHQSERDKTAQAEEIFEHIFGPGNALWEKRHEKAKNLSHGQSRLLGLLRIFMADFKLVLLDEPTAGVNPGLFDSITNILQYMANEQHRTIFLIEHNMAFVKKIATHCLFIHDGGIQASGTPAKVIDDSLVRKNYLGL
ncbi:MAG: ATP-binding cassette domain-containing protein [Bacteroidales bacterium]|nr:ATP-binding cassette domain-containing protein [Bacteroidales bacterium]